MRQISLEECTVDMKSAILKFKNICIFRVYNTPRLLKKKGRVTGFRSIVPFFYNNKPIKAPFY